MATESNRAQHLFVLRVWHEVSSVAPIAEWRGSIEHVTTGQRQYFAGLEEIDRIIREELGDVPPGTSPAAPPASPHPAPAVPPPSD